MSCILLCSNISGISGAALAIIGTLVDMAMFVFKDYKEFVNYWKNAHKSENYHVILNSIHPFVYVIEPAVRVFAFEPYRQWNTCKQKSR